MSDDEAKRLREELRQLEAMSDEDIDFMDMPEVTDFAGWERGKFYRPVKDQVTLRIDRDVLHWFKLSQERYQTAINAALREHMERHRKADQ